MSAALRGRRIAVAAIVFVAGLGTLALGGATASADQALPVCDTLFGPGFSATPNPAPIGQAISFDGSCSKVPCPAFGSFPTCDPGSYAWQFGDGATASGAKASHAYGAAGTYDVTLTVTDYNTNSYSVTHQVEVVGAP